MGGGSGVTLSTSMEGLDEALKRSTVVMNGPNRPTLQRTFHFKPLTMTMLRDG